MVPLHREVDRDAYTAGVAGFDLLPEQVAQEVRVPPLREGCSVEVDPTMMAAPEASYGIHPRPLERRSELLRVELRANTEDVFAGVEVQVDLAKPEI